MLWPHVRPQLGLLAAALFVALAIAALAAAQPLLTKWIIDRGLIARDTRSLLSGCLGMLGVVATGLTLGGVHRYIYTVASGRALFSVRSQIYSHLMTVSPRRLAEWPVGDLVSRLDADVAEVQRFGTDGVAGFVSSAFTLLAVAGVMIGLSARLSLLVAALLPLQFLVRHIARPRLERATRLTREAAASVSGFLVETLSATRAVQSSAAEASEAARLAHLAEAYLGRVRHQQVVSYAMGSASGLIGHGATVATFLIGGWYVGRGEVTVGTLIAFVSYLGRSAGSAASLASMYTAYQRARVSLERVDALMGLPAVAESAKPGRSPAVERGDLAFERVSLFLPGVDAPVLRDVSFGLPAGCKIVLSGASGAGKSTITDLLRRFIEPDEGRILLDGRALADYRLSVLRRAIVVVEHSPVLMQGTILANIGYALDASETEAVEAACRAGAHDFIMALPHGYHTRIGQGGAGLSTGERQRIAIARAVLADPRIVVFDEATSGLDPEISKRVYRGIDEVFGDRTRLYITHRADQVSAADQYWTLVDGKLLVGRAP